MEFDPTIAPPTTNNPFLTRPFEGAAPSSPGGAAVPGYEVLGELGHGGMGVVYKARHLGLNRVVALKMVLGGRAGEEELARFRREAESLARLRHPNIVQVYDVGECGGQPYFSLEFCGGGSLDRSLRKNPLTPRYAVLIVETLARAMAAAHGAGVIHRDLKPANVLLAEGSPQVPKITDFGLARTLDDAGQTQSGAIMGTPSYMAPEQAAGDVRKLGPSCDIYALGAILYECLTGRPPFRAATVMDTLILVRTQEPVPPSRLQPAVPRDLETICLKCLQKEPPKRYATADHLADDLGRFVRGEPIRARPVGRVERAVKWVRRKPVIAALLLAVLLVALVGGASFLWAYQEAVHNLDEAEKATKRAMKGEQDAKEASKQAQEERDRFEYQLAVGTVHRSRDAFAKYNASEARKLLEQVPDKYRLWEWHHLNHLYHGSIYTIYQVFNEPGRLSFSPDGERLAGNAHKGFAAVWDARTGAFLAYPRKLDRSWYKADDVLYSPRGDLLAFAYVTGGTSSHIDLWDVRSKKTVRTLSGPGLTPERLTFSPDGGRLAALFLGGPMTPAEVRVWEVDSGTQLHSLTVPPGKEHQTHLAYFPDRERLLVGAPDGKLLVLSPSAGEPRVVAEPTNVVTGVALSPNGVIAATTTRDGKLRFYLTSGDKPVYGPYAHGTTLGDIVFSPDGRTVAYAMGQTSIAFWDMATGQFRRRFAGETHTIQRLAFRPDGKVLGSSSMNGTVKVWDASNDSPSLVIKEGGAMTTQAAFADGGRLLATAGANFEARLWDTRSHRLLRHWPRGDGDCHTLAIRADGKALAFGGRDGTVELRDPATGGVTRVLRGPREATILSLAFSPSGDLLAVCDYRNEVEGDVTVWDTRDGRCVKCLPAAGSSLAFSPDGCQLAVTDKQGGGVRRWDTTTFEEQPRFVSPIGSLTRLRFSPDGKRMAAVNASPSNSAAIMMDVAGVTTHRVLRGHTHQLSDVVFSSDSRRLFSAAFDRTVRVWDSDSGQLVATLFTPGEVVKLDFEPGGTRLAVAGRGIALWDGSPVEGERALADHAGDTERALFSPDGRLLLTEGDEAGFRVWDAKEGRLLHRVTDLASLDRHVEFTVDSRYAISTNVSTKVATHWDMVTGERVTLADPPRRALPHNNLSPDGRQFAHLDGPTVRLISLAPPSERESERRRACTAPDIAWHVEEAADAERVGFWTGAMFHRGRLALAEPWNPAAWVRHAEAASRVGMNRQAALSYLRAYLR